MIRAFPAGDAADFSIHVRQHRTLSACSEFTLLDLKLVTRIVGHTCLDNRAFCFLFDTPFAHVLPKMQLLISGILTIGENRHMTCPEISGGQ